MAHARKSDPLYVFSSIHPSAADHESTGIKQIEIPQEFLARMDMSGYKNTNNHNGDVVAGEIIATPRTRVGEEKMMISRVDTDTLEGALTAHEIRTGKLKETSITTRFYEIPSGEVDPSTGHPLMVESVIAPVEVAYTDKGFRKNCKIHGARYASELKNNFSENYINPSSIKSTYHQSTPPGVIATTTSASHSLMSSATTTPAATSAAPTNAPAPASTAPTTAVATNQPAATSPAATEAKKPLTPMEQEEADLMAKLEDVKRRKERDALNLTNSGASSMPKKEDLKMLDQDKLVDLVLSFGSEIDSLKPFKATAEDTIKKETERIREEYLALAEKTKGKEGRDKLAKLLEERTSGRSLSDLEMDNRIHREIAACSNELMKQNARLLTIPGLNTYLKQQDSSSTNQLLSAPQGAFVPQTSSPAAAPQESIVDQMKKRFLSPQSSSSYDDRFAGFKRFASSDYNDRPEFFNQPSAPQSTPTSLQSAPQALQQPAAPQQPTTYGDVLPEHVLKFYASRMNQTPNGKNTAVLNTQI